MNKLTSNPPVGTSNPYTVDGSLQDPTGNNTNPRIAIINMYNNLDSNYEHGFGLYNAGNFPLYGSYAHYVQASMQQHVNFPTNPVQFGTIHTHPVNDEAIPMFSHDDIYTLISISDNYGSFQMQNTPNGFAVFVSILVIKQGDETNVYAIKIEDLSKLGSLRSKRQSQRVWDKYGEKLDKKYTEEADGISGSDSQYQKAFLKFVRDEDLGISLYQMIPNNPDDPTQLETWKKLTLSEDESNIVPTPCN